MKDYRVQCEKNNYLLVNNLYFELKKKYINIYLDILKYKLIGNFIVQAYNSIQLM